MKLCYVFTGVCLATGGGSAWSRGDLLLGGAWSRGSGLGVPGLGGGA